LFTHHMRSQPSRASWRLASRLTRTFQGQLFHPAQHRATLRPKGSWSTCIDQGDFLSLHHCASWRTLTNLPPRLGPRQVADLYRIRWEVELSIKVDKSVHRLDQIDAERPCSVKTLLHASLIASMIAALLAHRHNLQTQPPQIGAPRTEAPLHPRRLALQLAVSCQSIAQAFDLRGVAAKRRWQQLADLLTRSGRDPNWRRRPSILDQLRGWNRQPVTQKPASRRNLKAAA
jgi:hypothetical protein